jgi:DNA-binding MarR family transcriptional regulator
VANDIRQTGLMVKRLQVRHHRAADAALSELGVSLVQWDALRHLHENPGASLHDLAQLTFQTDQAFGTLATRLESRGLVDRVPGPGRIVHLRLTDQGERVRRDGAAVMERVLEDSFAPLTAKERATFHKLLRKLVPPPEG